MCYNQVTIGRGDSIKVIKRDGSSVDFNREKIKIAITKANKEVSEEEKISNTQINNIIKYIEALDKKRILVEDIQDIIEIKLMETRKFVLAKKYITYRYTRSLIRKSNTTDESILGILKNGSIEDKNIENSNIASNQKNLIAKEVSVDLTKRILLPDKIVNAHNDGLIYFHDMQSFIHPIFNCSLLNIQDILDNGTVINNLLVDTPKSFLSACNVVMQVIEALNNSQYGGMSIDVKHLGKYIRKTFDKNVKVLKKKYKDTLNIKDIKKIAQDIVLNEIKHGIQNIIYHINTMLVNNSKVKVTLFLNLEDSDLYKNENALIFEELLKQKKNLFKSINDKLVNLNQPKIIYVLNENNLKNNKYSYLTKIAIECKDIAFLSGKIMKKNYHEIYSPIGKNHFLPAYKVDGKYKFDGRFDQGVVSINLVNIALNSNKDISKFIELLNERLALCKEALLSKHYSLLGNNETISPLHYKHGAIARLNDKEKIDKLLKNGYSTLSLNYVGLSESVNYLLGQSIITDQGLNLGLKIINHIKDKVNQWSEENKIKFVIYTDNNLHINKYFLDCDQSSYGIIKNITDKEAYNSSYFISENIDLYKRLEYEKNFMKLANGGCLSLINIDEVEDKLQLLEYIYENIIYSELKEGDVSYASN